jgi:hypothetical protein
MRTKTGVALGGASGLQGGRIDAKYVDVCRLIASVLVNGVAEISGSKHP